MGVVKIDTWGDGGAYEGIDVDSLGTIYPFLSRPMRFVIPKWGINPDGSVWFDSRNSPILIRGPEEVEDARGID